MSAQPPTSGRRPRPLIAISAANHRRGEKGGEKEGIKVESSEVRERERGVRRRGRGEGERERDEKKRKLKRERKTERDEVEAIINYIRCI